MKKYFTKIKCPRITCKNSSPITDMETGEIICGKCGQVLLEKPLVTNKERTFSKEDFQTLTRTGGPTSVRFSDRGLSTIIGKKNKDSSGKKLSGKTTQRFFRLKLLDSRSKTKSSSERTLRDGLILIQNLIEKFSLNEAVAEKSALIFRKAHSQGLARGRSISVLAISSIYAACRFHNIPRNLTEISRKTHVSRKNLSRVYRNLIKNLDLKFEPFEPENFVSKISSRLEIDEKISRKTLKIIKKAKEEGFAVGKRPMALAAAALYYACIISNYPVSQRKLSKTSNISVPTIRKWSRKLQSLEI